MHGKPAKPKKGPRALVAWAANLFKRQDKYFIGYHGTNSNTADLWMKSGYPKKPSGAGGKAGGGTRLGDGLYITDHRETAELYAQANAGHNAGTTAMVCAIYAKSSVHWLNSVDKVWLPEAETGASHEASRNRWIEGIVPHVSPKNVVRFAVHDTAANEAVLPSAFARDFTASCFAYNATIIPPGVPAHFDYRLERALWGVKPCV